MSNVGNITIGSIFLTAWIISFVPQYYSLILNRYKKTTIGFWYIALGEVWSIISLTGIILFYYEDWKNCTENMCDNYFIGINPLIETIGNSGLMVLLMILHYKEFGIAHYITFAVIQIIGILCTVVIHEIIIQNYTVQVLYIILNVTAGISSFIILLQYIFKILNVHRVKVIAETNLLTLGSKAIINITWMFYLIFHYLAEPGVWIALLLQSALLIILCSVCVYYYKYNDRYQKFQHQLLYEQFV